MAYKYTAYNRENDIVTGMIDALNEAAVEIALQREGLNLITLEYVKPKSTIDEVIPSVFGIKTGDVVEFSQQLATLVESGISLVTSLHLLEEQTHKASFRKAIAGLRQEIQDGNSFSGALAGYGHIFPDIYCRIVATGERAGTLETSLRQAAEYLQKGSAAMQKARNAMIYPLLLIGLAVVAITLLMTLALPPLLTMFEELDIDLPWTTSTLLAITDFFSAYGLYLLAFLIIFAGCAVWYFKRPAGKRTLDRMLLEIPMLGQIVLKNNLAIFARTVSELFTAGIPLLQIMEIAGQTIGNSVVKDAVADVAQGLQQGRGLSQPMAASEIFPQLMVQVTMVGEQTGTLDANLANIADTYEKEVNRRTEALISMIEPIMIALMGVVVGFIALSVIMPMYSMLGEID